MLRSIGGKKIRNDLQTAIEEKIARLLCMNHERM